MKIPSSPTLGAIQGRSAQAPPPRGANPNDTPQEAKLRKSSQQLESVFVQEMYKAMRDTVPTEGPFNGGSGEQMFTGLLDERLAADTPAQWHHGLSEAIYRQLRAALPNAGSSRADSHHPQPTPSE